MIDESLRRRIYRYYKNPETKWGYSIALWDAKHLGYYPDLGGGIEEKQAQLLYHNKIAEVIHLRAGQKVLDAGCGRGVVACYLAKKYKVEIVGIDIVDFEIKKARARVKKHGVEGVSFEVMDYTESNFPPEEFDAIYANETLSHAPDLNRVFKEFFRVLKPGGRIALFEYTLAEDEAFFGEDRKNLDLVIETSGMAGLKQFRPGHVVSLLEQAGFTDVSQQNITKNVLPSFQRLNKLAKPFYPIIKIFGLQKIFINDVAAATFCPMAEKGLISFYIYSAVKPFF